MNIILISLKNVLKAKRRSLFTLGILSFGAMFYVLITVMIDSVLNLSINETIKEETAHIRVQSMVYDEDLPLSETNMWVQNDELFTQLENINYTPRLFMQAEMDNYQDMIPVMLMGIDPEKDRKVFQLPVSEDVFLEEGTIWIGANLATALNVQEGDYVNLTFRNLEGVQISAEYEITVLITSSNPQLSDMGVVVSLDEIQSLMETNVITYYSIKLDDHQNMDTMVQQIKEKFPNNNVLDKDKLLEDMVATITQKKKFTDVYILMILVITLMGIMNSIFISVWEKKRLTGTLRAIGYSDSSMVWLFMFEGAWMGFIGALLGVIIAMLINIPLSVIGIDFLSLMKVGGNTIDVGIYIPPIVYSEWDFGTFITPLIFTPIVSMFVSFFPAKNSIKMSIIDCIRTVD